MALRLLFLIAVLLFRSAGAPLAAEHPPVRVGAAASLKEAADFLAFLGEPPAQAIWRRHGFVVLR